MFICVTICEIVTLSVSHCLSYINITQMMLLHELNSLHISSWILLFSPIIIELNLPMTDF